MSELPQGVDAWLAGWPTEATWTTVFLGAAVLLLALAFIVREGWRKTGRTVDEAPTEPAAHEPPPRIELNPRLPVVLPGQPCPAGPHMHHAQIRRAQLTPREAAELVQFIAGVEAREVELAKAGGETADQAEAFLDKVRTEREERASRPYNWADEEDGGL